MHREAIVDLNAFATVAEERSFTKASVRLGTSPSALSHAVKRLETRIGVRLLHRTTRHVSPTDAGRQLLETLQASFESIAGRLNSLGKLQEEPSGSIRISASEHATETVLWPKLSKFLKAYPAIHMEVDVNQAGTDIVKEGYDAAVKLGHEVPKDMISVRISPNITKVYVASPAYLAGKSIPRTPRDLLGHDCITYRRPMTRRIAPWDFAFEGEAVQLRIEGRLVFNIDHPMIAAAVDGHGITCVVDDRVTELIAQGKLVKVLPEWSPLLTGLHLYYPSRRQNSAAFTLLVDTLRWKPTQG